MTVKQEHLKKMILDQNPTNEQKEAIFAQELEFLLRAAPGSGKTWTSCRRFIWRGAKWPYISGGLALLSFTNAAIREFYEATRKVGRRDLLSDPNFVGTFDSFVERFIITPFGHLIAGSPKRPKLFSSPLPGHWSNKKLQGWIQMSGGRKRPVPAWDIIPYPKNGKLAFKASNIQRSHEIISNGFGAVKEFIKMGMYTHEQRVFWSCYLLLKRPHIAKVLSNRFPEIIVDEAQDSNIWILFFLQLLRNKGTKITLIGDPDQCIYEFSLADASSLQEVKNEWRIPEKPLSKSFRCNNQIAAAVRHIGGNLNFGGYGDCALGQKYPLIYRESSKRFDRCINEFKTALYQLGIDERESAIICRGHSQLNSIYGEVTYTQLQGATKKLAEASFLRDIKKNYKKAYQMVEEVIRLLVGEIQLWDLIDHSPDCHEALQARILLWRFVKSKEGLPSVALSGNEWISRIRQNINDLVSELGFGPIDRIGNKIKRTGLSTQQFQLPLLIEQALFPTIRQETIHQVKGESIDAVLVLGSAQFWDSVVKSVYNDENTEDRRLAYVAMTRARHFLAIGIPGSHFDKYFSKWEEWGFEIIR